MQVWPVKPGIFEEEKNSQCPSKPKSISEGANSKIFTVWGFSYFLCTMRIFPAATYLLYNLKPRYYIMNTFIFSRRT